jgi:hypothetical protein
MLIARQLPQGLFLVVHSIPMGEMCNHVIYMALVDREQLDFKILLYAQK